MVRDLFYSILKSNILAVFLSNVRFHLHFRFAVGVDFFSAERSLKNDIMPSFKLLMTTNSNFYCQSVLICSMNQITEGYR